MCRASVPGTAVTIARLVRSSAFNRLDFPALGRPTMTALTPCRKMIPRSAVASIRCSRSMDSLQDGTNVLRWDLLLGEIDRGRAVRQRLHQSRSHFADRPRQVSSKLAQRAL